MLTEEEKEPIQKIRADLNILDNVLKKRLENKTSKAEVTRTKYKIIETIEEFKRFYK